VSNRDGLMSLDSRIDWYDFNLSAMCQCLLLEVVIVSVVGIDVIIMFNFLSCSN